MMSLQTFGTRCGLTHERATLESRESLIDTQQKKNFPQKSLEAQSSQPIDSDIASQYLVDSLVTAVAPKGVQQKGTTANSPVMTYGNKLLALSSGTPQSVQSACNAIDQAKSEILFQIYEWSDADESAQHVIAALNKRIDRALDTADESLSIRIVINQAILSWFRREHKPLREIAARLKAQPQASGRVYFELAYYPGPLLNVLHSKSLIVDGALAVVLTGNLKTHEALMGRDWYNMASSWAGPVVATLRADWIDGRRRSRVAASSAQAQPLLDIVPSSPALVVGTSLGACVLTRQSNWWYFNSGSKNPQDRGLLALINATKISIVAINPALNAPLIVSALIDAIIYRNVNIRLLLSLDMDRSLQHWLGGGDNSDIAYRLFDSVLKHRGEQSASRLEIRFASNGSGGPAGGNAQYNIHAKNVAFDDICLMTGSMNWDWQSWNNSRELSVAAFDKETVDAWKDTILQPLWTLAAPLRAEDIPKRHQIKCNRVYQYLQKQ